MTHRKQLTVFYIMLGVFALCAFLGYAFFADQLTAGERYMKNGLVAATGVHFWTDVVFHVIYGLF